jgi:hypothetical protein
MPPELVVLGDQLEAAVARAIARRRARRLTFLNAITSLLIAIPLAIAVARVELSRPQADMPAVRPAALHATRPAPPPRRPADPHNPDQFSARFRRDLAHTELLVLPTSLRPALR